MIEKLQNRLRFLLEKAINIALALSQYFYAALTLSAWSTYAISRKKY